MVVVRSVVPIISRSMPSTAAIASTLATASSVSIMAQIITSRFSTACASPSDGPP